MHAFRGAEGDRVDADDTPMTATYVSVMILEAVILVALWVFGRTFS